MVGYIYSPRKMEKAQLNFSIISQVILFKKILLVPVFFLLVTCSSIPKNTQNSCAIFEERYLNLVNEASKKNKKSIYKCRVVSACNSALMTRREFYSRQEVIL